MEQPDEITASTSGYISTSASNFIPQVGAVVASGNIQPGVTTASVTPQSFTAPIKVTTISTGSRITTANILPPLSSHAASISGVVTTTSAKEEKLPPPTVVAGVSGSRESSAGVKKDFIHNFGQLDPVPQVCDIFW